MIFLLGIRANPSPPFGAEPGSAGLALDPLQKSGISCAAPAKSSPNLPAGVELGSARGFTPGQRENPERGWKEPRIHCGNGAGMLHWLREDGAGIGAQTGIGVGI